MIGASGLPDAPRPSERETAIAGQGVLDGIALLKLYVTRERL
jgi:hypothetical protein